jgi:hypothetical protein
VTRFHWLCGLGTPWKIANDATRYTMTAVELFVLVSLPFAGFFGLSDAFPSLLLNRDELYTDCCGAYGEFGNCDDDVAEAAPHFAVARLPRMSARTALPGTLNVVIFLMLALYHSMTPHRVYDGGCTSSAGSGRSRLPTIRHSCCTTTMTGLDCAESRVQTRRALQLSQYSMLLRR